MALPLFATGGLYETFQMTVGFGTPTRDFNLTIYTLDSQNSQDFVLSENLVQNEDACSQNNLNRSGFYNSSLSSTLKWEHHSDRSANPFWQTIGAVALTSYVPLGLVGNITGMFQDGWNEAGFLSLRSGSIINTLMSQEGLDGIVTIRFYSIYGSTPHAAIVIGGRGEELCESEALSVGTVSIFNGPSLFVDSVRTGSSIMSVNTTALLALEYSISRIDQASLDVIAQLTGAVFNLSTELYYVDCSKTANMPDIFFKMGSFEYFLSSEFYTRQVSADECVLMFAGNNLSYVNTVWLLGTSFLKPYCLLIDYDRHWVSFAKIPGLSYPAFATSTAPRVSQSPSTFAIVAIAASSVLMIVILCGIVLFVFLRRKIMNQRIVTATPGTRYYYFKRFLSTKTGAHGEVYDEHELRPTDIRITDVLLGEGAYGKVYKGTLIASRRNVAGKAALATELTDEVAAKVLHSHASDQTRVEFRREIDLLKELSHHPHILNIVGCITLTPELVLVAEFCANGDLNATLRRHRACILLVRLRRSLQYCAELKESDVCDVGEDVCMVRKSLVSFAWQVSDGMVFLASKKLVHRDLAARNVLLTSKMVAKIADFGMCLRVEEAAVTESNKVPVRWTAPEALRSGQFSVASDVWSYGVLLYELFAGGDVPYQGIELEELLNYLEDGGRLKQPDSCPDEIYFIMEKCWMESPASRPSFEDIRSSVGRILEQRSYLYGYLDAAEHYWKPRTGSTLPRRLAV